MAQPDLSGARGELFPSSGSLPGNLCPYSFLFASSEYGAMDTWPRLVVRYH